MKMTKAQRAEWENLEKAYDYGSNDKRLSLKDFKRIWTLAQHSLLSACAEVKGAKDPELKILEITSA